MSDAAEDVIAIIRAGARGYVTKTISGPELADAVRRVAGGDAVFSPRLAGFVLDAFAGGGAEPAPAVDPELDQLTAREREVLQHIARGYLYKEIGARLHISAKTVEAHVSAVLRKLQLVQPARAQPLGRGAPFRGLVRRSNERPDWTNVLVRKSREPFRPADRGPIPQVSPHVRKERNTTCSASLPCGRPPPGSSSVLSSS